MTIEMAGLGKLQSLLSDANDINSMLIRNQINENVREALEKAVREIVAQAYYLSLDLTPNFKERDERENIPF